MPTETEWGLVVHASGASFDVEVEGRILTSNTTGNLRKGADRLSSPVVVGDRVRVEEMQDGTGMIREVAPRRTEFRRVRYRKPVQVIAANIDQALVAVAAAEPEPSFPMVDRFLLAVRVAGLSAHLVVTKADLLTPEIREGFAIYEKAGWPLLFTSSETGQGLDEVHVLVRNRVSLITGTSGVGKSSLLNELQPGLGLQVGAVSESTGKGKHTTRDFHLVRLERGGWVADTPGMRDLYVYDVPRDLVHLGFPELEPYLDRCRFANCGHASDAGCAIALAAEEGAIHPGRMTSFRDIYRAAPSS